MKQRMTIDEYRTLMGKEIKSGKKNKYHAKAVGGHASKKEHGRANQLKLMQLAGEISNLREQVPFVLIPTQRDISGTLLEHQCRYIADFVYNDADGNQIVEDTKGFRTPEYKIKRKLMLAVHGIRIKEI